MFLLLRLLLESLYVFLGAERHARNPSRPRIRQNDFHLAVTFDHGNVARFRSERRERILGPFGSFRIKLDDFVRIHQINPDVVILVHHGLIGFLNIRPGEGNDCHAERLRIDLGKVSAPPVANPNHVALFVRTHSARTLGPRRGRIPCGSCRFIHLYFLRRELFFDSRHRRNFNLRNFSRLEVGLGDDIEIHFGPPAVAVAVRGQPVGVSDSVGVFKRGRLVFGELLGHGIETRGSVKRGSPDLSLTVHVHGSCDERRPFHRIRWRINLKRLRRRIDFNQASGALFFAWSNVEPDVALCIPICAVPIGGKSMRTVHAEEFHFACFCIDTSETRVRIRHVHREPDVSVEVRLRVVHSVLSPEGCRRAQKPVVAVIERVFFRGIVRGKQRHIIFGEDHACRISLRPRPHLESFYGAWFRTSCPRKVRGKFFLVEINGRRDRTVRAQVTSGHVDALHHFQNRGPPLFVKLVLQNVIRLVAAGAAVTEHALQAAIVSSFVRQRCEHLVTGELLFKVLRGFQNEILMLRRREIHVAARRLESIRLRPHFVAPGVHRREIIGALFVRKHGCGDRRVFHFGGDSYAAHPRAIRRFHRSGQQRAVRRCVSHQRKNYRQRKHRESGADDFHGRTNLCVMHRRLSFFLVKRPHRAARGRFRALRRLRHRFQIFDYRVNFRGLQSQLESRHFARSAADDFLNGVFAAVDEVLVQGRAVHLESRPRRRMANGAALLENTLAKFLGIGERLISVCLLRARAERKNGEENQKSPAQRFHGGFSSADFITNVQNGTSPNKLKTY